MSGDVVSQCLAFVGPAETAYRSRWRLSTLQRVNADLHGMLVEQIDLYNTALVTGSDGEAKLQAEAMVRGWRAACAALEGPLLPDDAYQVGFDANTGLRVVIAEQKDSIGRVQVVKGERVLIVTPDEVARMVAGLQVLSEAKAAFPDAELVSVAARPTGPPGISTTGLDDDSADPPHPSLPPAGRLLPRDVRRDGCGAELPDDPRGAGDR